MPARLRLSNLPGMGFGTLTLSPFAYLGMKYLFVVALFVVAAAHAGGSRTFTSKDGRTIQGEILSTTDQDASLKLADGRRVAVPFTSLTDKDVAAVKKWSKVQELKKSLEKGD
jgi:hypothetical protein